ncbi:hypothetical protein OF83DRAFT_787834 [Amylostereum chailletii]|nr:hypothetical protein OF83DRAFT_787834 [Amylostereum chailletii]
MSSTVNTRLLNTLSSSERVQVFQILLDAFEHSAIVQPFTGQNCTPSDILSRYIDAALQKGELWVTGFGNDIQGVAIWFGPGQDYGFIPQDWFDGLVSDDTKDWLVHHGRPLYEELYKSSYPTGTSLIQTKMLKGNGAYTTDVSTSSAVLFFEKLGFLYKGVKNFVSSSSSGFPLWCMYRGPSLVSKPTAGT